jgi:uncharacterized protein YcaQ
VISPALAFLLRAQALDGRRPRTQLVRVVRRLIALQAQIPSTPVLSLAARVERVASGDVARLEKRRALLRVWCLRGTLHVIHAGDYALLHGAIMRDWQRVVRRMIVRHDGLSMREVLANERAILRELERGPRTRAELRTVMPRGAALYWGREIRGLCCSGRVVHAGRRGGEVVFDLLERWAPHARPDGRPVREARRDLFLRYLDGYGPATARDFAYWLGVGAAEARQAVADAGRRVRETEHGLIRRGAEWPPPPLRGAPVRLLPRFDVYLLGHRDKSRYLDERHYGKVFRPSAVVEPVILADGRVAGTWDYGGGERFFGPTSRRVRAAARAERAGQ